MGFLSQQLLLSRLKAFVKNLDKDKIKTCLRSGTIELHDVELEEGPLRELLEDALPGIVPFGVEIVASFVDTLQIMVPWTKLQSQAVEVHIGHVHTHCLWHLPGNISSNQYFNKMQTQAAKKAARKANGSSHKVPVKETIFDNIIQIGTLVTVASVEINIGRDGDAAAMVIRMLDVSLSPENRDAKQTRNGEQSTRSTFRAAFRKTSKGPATTPYRQARHFSKRQKAVGLWRRAKLKQLVFQFGEERCSLFDVVLVEERSRASDGRRTCPWNIMVACWLGLDCVEYHGTAAGIGRLLALLDEFVDSEALRQEAPKAVAEASRALVSLDDFLGGDIDFGDDSMENSSGMRGSMTSEISLESDTLRCAQEELEKEGVKWEEDDVSDEDDDDSFSTNCSNSSRKTVTSKAGSDAGIYVGSMLECAVDRVNIYLPGVSVCLRSTCASIQTSRPLKDDESDAYSVLFGKFTNSMAPSQAGAAKGKSCSVKMHSQQSLELGEPIRRQNSSIGMDASGAKSFAEKLIMESRDDRDDTFRPTTRQTVRQPRASSVPSSVRKSCRVRSGASPANADRDDGSNASFEVKFENVGKGLPSFEVDATRLRVSVGGCKDLMKVWQEQVLVEREAYRDVRPKEESQGDKRVPYHLILRDLIVSEESINFESMGRFPTVTEINHIDIRTVGPSPTSLQAAPPKYQPRLSALNPSKMVDDPEQQKFWSRFAGIGGKRR